jgi:transglutaminase-like putative cysteine protease
MFERPGALWSAMMIAGLVGFAGEARGQWIAPTPEELKMTSIAEAPDAKAVVLYRDELTEDDNHMWSTYMRVKVLTEAGKDLGNVRIGFNKRSDGRGYTVDQIAGRTIEPDGTIVPFTGKPYEKVVDQGSGYKRAYKVFSMPQVQVGSIIEYRYKLRWEDNWYAPPEWEIQTDLYLRKGHFLWKPTDKELLHTSRGGRESGTSTLVWSAALPKGVEVSKTRLPTGRLLLEVNVQNVAPFGLEEYMPPFQTAAYHVFFYYSPYHTPQEYWKTEGGYWSSDTNKFVGNSGYVREAATAATAGATTDEEKAKRLYALARTIENTDYSRKRDRAEEKQEGLKETKSAEDVLRRKRGTGDEIAMTFVALARAAGLNASVMAVSDRSFQTINASWLDFGRQLNDDIAVVAYDGKDHFFDPGSPYTTFGHLSWKHSLSGGVRQQGRDTAMIPTPAEGYKDSKTARIANLVLMDGGHMSGTVTLRWSGSPAVEWRQTALRNDEAELRELLTKYAQSVLPGGTEVKLTQLEGVSDEANPLKAVFAVSGNLGSAAGSRVVVPSDIFVEHQQPTFPHAEREQPVYFHYAEMVQDAVRIAYPEGFTVESAPAEETVKLKQNAVYSQKSKQVGNTITVWRDLTIGEIYYPVEEFPDLRKFYADFEHKDHSSIVLKRAVGAGPAAAASGGQ